MLANTKTFVYIEKGSTHVIAQCHCIQSPLNCWLLCCKSNRILGIDLQGFRSRIMSPGLWESPRLKELAIPNAGLTWCFLPNIKWFGSSFWVQHTLVLNLKLVFLLAISCMTSRSWHDRSRWVATQDFSWIWSYNHEILGESPRTHAINLGYIVGRKKVDGAKSRRWHQHSFRRPCEDGISQMVRWAG